jgi:transcriptional regulator with GAF, ATPase, and Fis domain
VESWFKRVSKVCILVRFAGKNRANFGELFALALIEARPLAYNGEIMNLQDNQHTAALYRLSREILRLESYEQLLDAIVHHSLAMLRGDRGFLVLVRSGGLDFKVVRNWSPEEPPPDQEPVSRAILQMVLQEQRPILIEDAARDPRFHNSKSVRHLQIRSVLAAPLYFEKKINGVLYLESRQAENLLTDEELALFQEILFISERILSFCLHRLLLEQRAASLEQELLSQYKFEGIITQDKGFLRVLEGVAAIASSDLPVLIQGKSGTGKELIARALHANSTRRSKTMVTVNCSALSSNLLESELFGYVKGAFTGALKAKQGLLASADGSTLFLDEIGELPKELQAKLLRALQFGEVYPIGATQPIHVDVRFVAATNRDLELEVKEGRFREDLLFRLNAASFVLPALRDRQGDILPLFTHFLRKECAKQNRAEPKIEQSVERGLLGYSWPGNIRELEHETKRLLAVTPIGLPLTTDRLSPKILQEPKQLSTLAEQERQLVLMHLEYAGNNRTQAAATLGLSREGLRLMMKRLGLQ